MGVVEVRVGEVVGAGAGGGARGTVVVLRLVDGVGGGGDGEKEMLREFAVGAGIAAEEGAGDGAVEVWRDEEQEVEAWCEVFGQRLAGGTVVRKIEERK